MKKTGSFRFEAVDEVHNVSGTYTYDDAWFADDASLLSPMLRMMSMCLSLACFPDPEDKNRAFSNAEKLLTEMGYRDLEVNEDFRHSPREYTLGVLIARKEVSLQGENCAIYAVGFRGASYGREWYGNTIIEKQGIPVGFRIALHKTMHFLQDYLERHGSKEKERKKLWITGFSRAAAAAGLAGAAATRHAKRWGLRKEDIFVYTYEAPRCMPKELNVAYSNIHNTVSRVDMVPLIAPESWGFIRPGVDDTILPSPKQKEWQDQIKEVRAFLKSLNPAVECEEEGFVPLAISGFQLKPIREAEKYHRKRGKLEEWWYDADIGDYFPLFIRFMGSKLALSVGKTELTDREAYAQYYEKSFAMVAKRYLGSNADQRDLVRGVLAKMLEHGSTPIIRAVFYVILKGGRNRVLRRVASRLSNWTVFRIMTTRGFKGNRKILKRMSAAIENMIYYFLYCASCDVRENDFAFLGTLGANIDRLRGAHAPELIYSWLVSDRYTGEPE